MYTGVYTMSKDRSRARRNVLRKCLRDRRLHSAQKRKTKCTHSITGAPNNTSTAWMKIEQASVEITASFKHYCESISQWCRNRNCNSPGTSPSHSPTPALHAPLRRLQIIGYARSQSQILHSTPMMLEQQPSRGTAREV